MNFNNYATVWEVIIIAIVTVVIFNIIYEIIDSIFKKLKTKKSESNDVIIPMNNDVMNYCIEKGLNPTYVSSIVDNELQVEIDNFINSTLETVCTYVLPVGVLPGTDEYKSLFESIKKDVDKYIGVNNDKSK